MASVTFYNNGSNPNVLNKALTALDTVDVDFKEPVDVSKPVIFIAHNSSIIGANYCYIPWFHRYYYGHIEGERSQTMRFVCDGSDPLMSFKDAILASPAVISRNPWEYDMYIPDTDIPIEARSARAIIKFPNESLFDGNNNCYILTVVGSGS